MKKITLLGWLTLLPLLAQQPQPRFVLADVHSSTTAQGFAQNFGSVLRGGRYVNRDATMLNLIERNRVTEAIILLRAHITQSKLEVRKITLSMLAAARDSKLPFVS